MHRNWHYRFVFRVFSVQKTREVISISAIKRPREPKFTMKIFRGQNNHFHKRLLRKFLLPWQQEGISISQLYRNIKTQFLCKETCRANKSFPPKIAEKISVAMATM